MTRLATSLTIHLIKEQETSLPSPEKWELHYHLLMPQNPEWMVCGIMLGGWNWWFPEIDPRTNRLLIDNIIEETVNENPSNILSKFNSPMKRINAICIYHYYTKLRRHNKDILMLSIISPNTSMGESTTTGLFSAAMDPETHAPLDILLFGGSKFCISPFPRGVVIWRSIEWAIFVVSCHMSDFCILTSSYRYMCCHFVFVV